MSTLHATHVPNDPILRLARNYVRDRISDCNGYPGHWGAPGVSDVMALTRLGMRPTTAASVVKAGQMRLSQAEKLAAAMGLHLGEVYEEYWAVA